jgi:hypothetical protein
MKNALVVCIFLLAGVAIQQPAAAQYVQPASPNSDDIARYNLASTEARRRYFAAAMSNLTPEQLQVFWDVYAEYEKEKDAIAMARTDLATKYLDAYSSEGGPQDAELTQLVYDAGELQKKNTDLRLKYFGIYSQRLNTRAAARFALIDDYETTAVRMNLFSKLPLPANAGGQ